MQYVESHTHTHTQTNNTGNTYTSKDTNMKRDENIDNSASAEITH